MSEVTSIHPADLSYIEKSLHGIESNISGIHGDLISLDSTVDAVDDNVRIVQDKVTILAGDFHEFVQAQLRANRKQVAHTELVRIRQELEKKYGHYDNVRRMTTGILQADDLGIVRKETINNATEETMLATPGYWLSPCLVALAAWISDKPELADKAMREGIKRDDEKTSLFFALICRRADRKQASLKWTQRYLANQNEERLDRKTIIILDAFASGLLGMDSEGLVAKQMAEWLDRLKEKPGFVEQQTKQWSDAINLKRPAVESDRYQYLRKYSKSWPALESIMEGAQLHSVILDYFISIFQQEASTDSLKEQLDEILSSLVNDFDDEELPLRTQERFEQLVINCDGDEPQAKASMEIEKSALEVQKDFTQLLTDAAMKPETTHSSISTQKFALALSKEWIETAYNDVTAQNRMKIPNEIEINVDTFNGKSKDGQNEEELIQAFNSLVDTEKQAELSHCTLSGFESFCLYGGIAVGVVGLLMVILNNLLLGIIAIIAGIGLIINHFSKKKRLINICLNIQAQYEEKRSSGTDIIRAVLAEIVDFRREFSEKDGESQKVMDFLDQITPDQYVKKLDTSIRKIDVRN